MVYQLNSPFPVCPNYLGWLHETFLHFRPSKAQFSVFPTVQTSLNIKGSVHQGKEQVTEMVPPEVTFIQGSQSPRFPYYEHLVAQIQGPRLCAFIRGTRQASQVEGPPTHSDYTKIACWNTRAANFVITYSYAQTGILQEPH